MSQYKYTDERLGSMKFDVDGMFNRPKDEALFKVSETLPKITTCKIDSNRILIQIDQSYGNPMVIATKLIGMASPNSQVANWLISVQKTKSNTANANGSLTIDNPAFVAIS